VTDGFYCYYCRDTVSIATTVGPGVFETPFPIFEPPRSVPCNRFTPLTTPRSPCIGAPGVLIGWFSDPFPGGSLQTLSLCYRSLADRLSAVSPSGEGISWGPFPQLFQLGGTVCMRHDHNIGRTFPDVHQPLRVQFFGGDLLTTSRSDWGFLAYVPFYITDSALHCS
jgi:hypothetical protein